MNNQINKWAEWQKNYRYGTLVILPPHHIMKVIDELRQRYDPISQKICEAHITLTQPFIGPLNDNNLEKLEIIAAKYKSFSIQYGPLNNFLPYPCIYFEIHPVEKIMAIRNAMHEAGMCNLSLPYSTDFIPHMSITDGRPDPATTEKIYEELCRSISGGAFDCSEISLIVPDRNFHFKTVRHLRLQS
jgi:2'-5' RNA ligase